MYDIEIISAPSILGLKPSGVEELSSRFLENGLAEKLHVQHPVVHVPTLNHLYSSSRDMESNCINTTAIKDFSSTLITYVEATINNNCFPCVLGGDCSILLGIMPALKLRGTFGVIFLDAHADFYEPKKSITGEVADMDLAIITGRGPEPLTNINNLAPYVNDKLVVHIGQRDQEETRKYGSQDIRDTAIKCISLDDIETSGIEATSMQALEFIGNPVADGYWIHFDTDVLSDDINPAVDYRLPGGMSFIQTEFLLKQLLSTGRIVGMSVTIYNPKLDPGGHIAKNIVDCLGRAFEVNGVKK